MNITNKFIFLDFDSCIAFIESNISHTGIIKTNVCGEHGKCISEPFSDFSCVCEPGYTGRYCHESKLLNTKII